MKKLLWTKTTPHRQKSFREEFPKFSSVGKKRKELESVAEKMKTKQKNKEKKYMIMIIKRNQEETEQKTNCKTGPSINNTALLRFCVY